MSNPQQALTKFGAITADPRTIYLADALRTTSSGESFHFFDRDNTPRVAIIKTASAIKASYFSGGLPKERIYDDEEIGRTVFSADLGHYFWRQKFSGDWIRNAFRVKNYGGPADINRLLDLAAIDAHAEATAVLAEAATSMPSAHELLFSYRVIQRLINIINSHEDGCLLHQARGFHSTEFDQFDLRTVLNCAAEPVKTAFGRQSESLISLLNLPKELEMLIINIRNDGEIAQAIFLGSIFKRRYGVKLKIVLEAAGGNEQFDFGSLRKPFQKHKEELSKYIDYFLPKQDYRATLVPLIDLILRGETPAESSTGNLIVVRKSPVDASPRELERNSIDHAFRRHTRTTGTFFSAGRRTFLGRISPARCHWSACSFCTINSQHIVPTGTIDVDSETDSYIEHLIDVLREREVQSLILMDEAIHPTVLTEFARRLIGAKISVVYRARSRFTDHLDPENCKLLYESGCRYLGMGLEARSTRVNQLVNKLRGDPPDYDAILDNLEAAGVRPHIYSIMGFPTETEQEIYSTEQFLLGKIRNSKYITVSANNFYLMRGSFIARHPDRYGISDIIDRGDLSLVLDFSESTRDKNREIARSASQAIYEAEFGPHLGDPDFSEGFWHFVDQAGVFYVQKVEESENPYRALQPPLSDCAPSLGETILSAGKVFEIDVDIDTIKRESDDRIICEWVTQKYAVLNPNWVKIVSSMARPTRASRIIEDLPEDERKEAPLIISELLEAGILLRA